ncbi:methyltransferase family protein [Terracidiphilus sp.]|uniref:methyltransferase family protein n=1 Tax=Terracidiphilus sp. TaxID=1964191 RepID=UPI003C1EC079
MTETNSAPVTPERILQMAWGFSAPLILEAAIKNRVFDVLDEGPKSLAETAQATGASERGLAAIMNAQVGFIAFLEHFSSCCRATPAWPQKQIRYEGGAHELYTFGRDARMLRPGTAATEDLPEQLSLFVFPVGLFSEGWKIMALCDCFCVIYR